MIARDLGIDPLDLRLRNVMTDGDTALTGEAIHAPRAREVLEAVRREARWDARERKPGRGYGIGFACRHTGGGKTSLVLRLDTDGSLEALTAVPDQGSGSATVIARVVAAAMSIDAERIAIRRGNTAEAPNDPGAGASRVTHIVGGAAEVAGKAMRERLETLAGMRLIEDAFVDDATGRSVPFAEVAARACIDGPVEVVGKFDGTHTDPSAHPADYSFSAFAVTADVDARTGAFRLSDVVFVVDVGTILNPVSHQGQIDGGYVYGLGNALLEELPVDDGKIATLNLSEYKLPSIADVPPLRTVLLAPEHAGGPFGAKMAGELSNTGIGPAIANAIDDACGARIPVLPITSERVFTALQKNK
jgi:CO/xanthine dehydrogenase Mo-binding subunit